MLGAEGMKIFDFDNPRSLEKAFSGKELHQKFYLLRSTKSTKTIVKVWEKFLMDFFGRLYRTNSIKTRLGSPLPL